MKQARSILAILLFGCAVMAVVDGVIQPGYAIKSLAKLTLFLGLPLWWSRQAGVSLRPLFARPRQGLGWAAGIGAGVFAVILGGFFLTRGHLRFLRPHRRPHCRHRSAPGKFPLGRPLHLLW